MLTFMFTTIKWNILNHIEQKVQCKTYIYKKISDFQWACIFRKSVLDELMVDLTSNKTYQEVEEIEVVFE